MKKLFGSIVEKGTKGKIHIELPIDVRTIYGKPRTKVRGTVNDTQYRGLIVPKKGSFYLAISNEIVDSVGLGIGDKISVSIEVDNEKLTPNIPDDLMVSLTNSPQAAQIFEKLPYSHQIEYIKWIEEAKKPETRLKRLQKTIQMLLKKS